MTRFATRILLPALLIALVAVPASAELYNVRLNNGTLLQTRYAPEDAPFDESMYYFMTLAGNGMAIAKSEVAEIESVLEMQGRGTMIDRNTILIGQTANDNLTPEELEALGEEPAQSPIPFTTQQFAEPGQGGGGIPVWFTNQTTPPIGGGASGGGQANLRRSGGGGQFVEPNAP